MISFSILSALVLFPCAINGLSLSVAPSGGNASSLTYGLLFEDGWHSGDGGLYGEMIRDRAFQGTEVFPGQYPSLDRSTQWWTPFGGASIAIDTSTPVLSPQLPYQMRMDVPAHTTGPVGFSNAGFWGFDVDSTRNYTVSMYMRGAYTGTITCQFQNYITGQILSSVSTTVKSKAGGSFKQIVWPQFYPTVSPGNPNNTFSFIFENGNQIAGSSVYVNLLSLFGSTYNNRPNGLRPDMVQVIKDIDYDLVRIPGGNNLEGVRSPYLWEWSQTIGPLTQRPGRPGTWTDIDTEGLGLMELMEWTEDLNTQAVLDVWAGLYLDGEVTPQSGLGNYVMDALNEYHFLTDPVTTKWGKLRASYGHPAPFTNIAQVEIGNEDFLNGGYNSYYAYRYPMFYKAFQAAYPNLTLVSSISPPPVGSMPVDLHYYGNEADFVAMFNAFDHIPRTFKSYVNEYAVLNTGNNGGEIGAQTISMVAAEAIFLLGVERNSDCMSGTAYGVMAKEYNEKPDTVALIKHTADQILITMSYRLQQLFIQNNGDASLPVTATGGGFGPVYWSAQKNATNTILKLVNYNGASGSSSSIPVTIVGSSANQATLITMTAPSQYAVNNLPQLGGEANVITSTVLSGSNGVFNVAFSMPYEIVILVV